LNKPLANSASPTHADASPWVQRWSHLIAPGSQVLDVACGQGRHTRWLASRGCHVTALDRDTTATQSLHSVAEVVTADIEQNPWPLPGRRFDAIIVTHYLWRPLMPTLLASLREGGVLIYETFGIDQARIGKPSNPAFLLQPGELLTLTAGLHTVAYENGQLSDPPRFVQRLAAVQTSPSTQPRAPHLLLPPAPTSGR
jgi:SAM-dependent methyltransferase